MSSNLLDEMIKEYTDLSKKLDDLNKPVPRVNSPERKETVKVIMGIECGVKIGELRRMIANVPDEYVLIVEEDSLSPISIVNITEEDEESYQGRVKEYHQNVNDATKARLALRDQFKSRKKFIRDFLKRELKKMVDNDSLLDETTKEHKDLFKKLGEVNKIRATLFGK